MALFLVIGCAVQLPAQVRGRDHDDPRRRAESFYKRRAFPFDKIPPGALQQARRQLDAANGSGFGLFTSAPPISGTQWQSIGPQSIPIYGTSIGRVTTVAVDPTNSQIIYIGGAQGGVWKTTDGGANWTPLTDNQCSLAMGALAIDPVNPSILYAGTGEQNYSGDSYWGCGVLLSTDGGANWSPIGPAAFQTASVNARIAKIVIAPTTAGTPASTTLLAATSQGLYRTTDGGTIWTATLSGPSFYGVSDVVIDPANDSVAYAGVYGGPIYKSTDRGASWTAVSTGLPSGSTVGRISLAIAPSAPDTLYASIANNSTDMLLGLWRTTNGGTVWSQLAASGASCGNQCWYDMPIAVSPTDVNTVYLGGVGMYRSTDGGATFSDITGGMHVDQHAIAFDPQTPATMYMGNDGGVWGSTNGGNSWTSLNQGLVLTQFYAGISIHPSDPTIAMGGAQDNGTVQYNGTVNWVEVLGGDGGYTAIDQTDAAIRYAEPEWGYPSSSGPWRSDGGAYTQVVNGINLSDRAEFIPPLVMDPSNSSVLYFGTYVLYRTTNRGDLWTAISPDLTGGGVNDKISAIAPAPSNPATIYVGATSGLVYVTRDTGTTWTNRTTGLPARYISDFAVERGDDSTAYVGLSGFGSGHVFRTANAGASWTDVSGNLPDVPVNAVLTDPGDRGIVLVGTDIGVFMSSDSGGTWAAIDQGLPHVAVFGLAYNPATGVLLAGTHGRGMFQLQLNRPLTLEIVPGTRRDTVLVGSTATSNDSAAVVLSGTNAGTATWSATHTSASWITLTSASGTGAGTVSWTRDPTGLATGVHVDTITVTSAGATDSPWQLTDSLVVETVLTMTVNPTVDTTTAELGVTGQSSDSAYISLTGSGASTAPWTAAISGPNTSWIGLNTPNGAGSGYVRWTLNPLALTTVGTYSDTIAVTAVGAAGTPMKIVTVLQLEYPPIALSASAVTGTAVSGTATTSSAAVQVLLNGGTDDTTAWTAAHSAAANWLTLATASGVGSDSVKWTRTAHDVKDGTYTDTITVVTAHADTARIVDAFTVTAPTIAADCAARVLLATACLDSAQARYLDLAGNADGTFNLGDFLAWLARGQTAASRAANGRTR